MDEDKTEVVLFSMRQKMEKLKENDTAEIKIGSQKIKAISISKKPWLLHGISTLISNTHSKSLWHSTLHCGKDL